MKSIVMFILWCVLGVFVAYKYGSEYLTEQLATNMTTIVDQVMTNGIGSGGQNIANQYQGQAQELLESQKTQIKEEIKKQLTDYISQKLDETFK